MNRWALSAAFLVASVVPAIAQTPPNVRAVTPVIAGDIDAIARGEIRSGRTPGLAVAVIEEGRVAYSRRFGFANLAPHVPFTENTETYCGPLTMQFTAAATLLLSQAGKLKLDDPVTRYVPELKTVASGVTIAQLLSQTSGLPEISALQGTSTDQTRTVKPAALLAAIDKAKPHAPPGVAYDNNPLNYLVAGIVVERVSGETLSDYLQQQIFAPLFMERTFLAGDSGIAPNAATGYVRDRSSGFVRARPLDPAWLMGARGLVSTADDLAKWDIEMPLLLHVDAVRTMFAPVEATGTAHVSLGWIADSRAGHRFLWYGGGIPGYDAANLLLPDDHVAVIVLSNAGASGRPGYAAHLGNRVLDLVAPVNADKLDNAILLRAKEWLARLEDKQIDRTQLTPNFSTYLSDDFVARQNLASLGKVESIVPLSSTTQTNGDTLYVFYVRFTHAQYHYKFAVTSNGKIDELLLMY